MKILGIGNTGTLLPLMIYLELLSMSDLIEVRKYSFMAVILDP